MRQPPTSPSPPTDIPMRHWNRSMSGKGRTAPAHGFDVATSPSPIAAMLPAASERLGKGLGNVVVVTGVREATGMSMELSNYLVSWVVTYLGDLQPTYIGVIIYLLSSMDILVP